MRRAAMFIISVEELKGRVRSFLERRAAARRKAARRNQAEICKVMEAGSRRIGDDVAVAIVSNV